MYTGKNIINSLEIDSETNLKIQKLVLECLKVLLASLIIIYILDLM